MFPRDLVHSVEVAFKLLDYFHPIFSKFSSIVPALSGTMEILFTIRRCRLPMYDSLEVHRSRRSRIVLVGPWDIEILNVGRLRGTSNVAWFNCSTQFGTLRVGGHLFKVRKLKDTFNGTYFHCSTEFGTLSIENADSLLDVS
jgi:hypothetical protein